MNNLPTRPGLHDDHTAAVNTLLFSYDSKETDDVKRGKVAIYKQAVTDLPQWCVEQAMRNFVNGVVERKNADFRPSVEAFAKEARRVLDDEKRRQETEEIRRKLTRMAQEPPSARPGMSPYEKRMERIQHEMRGRAVLSKSVPYQEFKIRCSRMEYPVGAQWMQGTVYGPERSE